ncbi:MAG: DNA polymerase III subunit epsilon [Actinobacteria bacterium]|nr:MAG: DNA polymerase III subunit epsilon [Actinomycetota bacterium]
MLPKSLELMLAPGTDPEVAASYARLAGRARDAEFGFEDEVAFVDIETTGFDLERDSIIEVAAVIARGPQVVARYGSFVDPGRKLPVEIVKLTGITDAALAGAPPVERVVIELAEFLGGRDIVAHHASFDRTFLEAAGLRARGAWLDSLEVARIALPRLESHRLIDIAAAFDLPASTHRATDDVEALAAAWRVMLCGLDALPEGVLQRIAELSPSTLWALRPLIARMAAARPAPPVDLKKLRRHLTRLDSKLPMCDADDVALVSPEPAEVSAAFTDEGAAGRMYPGYERRDEQERMSLAVSEAFATRTHLAIEAGTGVGKSVAYLLPSALFATRNSVTVGVATKTNALTDQLMHSELPALDEALGGGLRYVALKGYENYACLRKLDRASESLDGADAETVGVLAALIAWVAQSPWGDLDAVNLHWRRDVRQTVACAVADCTKQRCRFYPNHCYLHGARRRAEHAHVVVTNHALLFRGMAASGGVLPPIRHWVVDEAHGAEAEARRQLSLEASHSELRAALGSLHAKGKGGLLDLLRKRATKAMPDAAGTVLSAVEDMRSTVETAATLTDTLFEFVKDLSAVAERGSGYDRVEMRVTRPLRDTGAWGHVANVGRSLARKLEHLVERGRAVTITLEEHDAPGMAEVKADLAGLLTRIADQLEGLVAVVDGTDDDFVYAAALDRRPDVRAERLSALLLDVGRTLATGFYPETHSVVFCSATITAGADGFAHFAHSVGLDRLPEGSWRGVRLESSYDFERQMSVFVASDVGTPSSRGYLDDLERLLEGVHAAMGGSVLTLFTNRRDMETLYDRLEPRLESAGVPLSVQSRGSSRKRIRDEFLAHEALSLFATKSFWEGFDAKGDTLRCVIVPKLPFGQVNDPLLEERKERDGAWWAHYYLPEAILELKQAAGRLIRSKTDEGCLVLADSRLVGGEKRYGPEFLAALPVRDVEVLPIERIVEEIERRYGRPVERPAEDATPF